MPLLPLPAKMIPRPLKSRMEELMLHQLREGGATPADFLEPAGEPALVPADSVSWKVFANPVTLMIGGIAAVILELAEPRVRSGVWDHTTFRSDPLKRMRRTGAAAMVTVYAARSRAVKMIGGVRKMHERVRGITPDGMPYQADDPDLLRWVHATAAYGFLEAYHRYARPLTAADKDGYFAEGVPVAVLYGAAEPPASEAEWNRLIATMLPLLEPSAILSEFLGIMRNLPLLPGPLRPLNHLLVAAAIDLLPDEVRHRLEMPGAPPVPAWRLPLRLAAGRAEKMALATSPRSLARLRIAPRLPENRSMPVTCSGKDHPGPTGE